MRLTFALFASLATTVLASPIQLHTRDASVAERAISIATTSFERLSSAVQTYQRNPQDNPAFKQQNIDLGFQEATNSLREGASRIRKGSHIDKHDSGKLVSHLNGLLHKTEIVLNALVAAKSAIISSGGKSVIYRSLKDQERAAHDFGEALNSKGSDGIGSSYGKRAKAAFEQAMHYFN
jgi:hypothetical protein